MTAGSTEIARQVDGFRSVYQPPGRYVNDHCFVRDDDGVTHLFHITGPAGRRCYAPDTEISFGHATSRDLRAWTSHDDVLPVLPGSATEPHHVFAPYVVARDGLYHMFYTGIDRDLQAEAMCLATSTDLFHWDRHPFNPVFRPSRHWADHAPGSGAWACCRDAHVLPHPEHGYILYYVAWLRGAAGERVAFGAALSPDLISWQDAGSVLEAPRAWGTSTTSMESPCVVAREGRYFLFYKYRDETRLVVSHDPLRFPAGEDRWFSVAHAAEIFAHDGRWLISHCSREPDDLRHERTDRTRGLWLAGLDWAVAGPQVVPA